MKINHKEIRDELSEAFNLGEMPVKQQEELLAKMGEALLKRIFLETMEKIGDEGVREYEGLLEREAGEEEIEAFFEGKIPGYQVFVRDIVTQFKDDMQANFSA